MTHRPLALRRLSLALLAGTLAMASLAHADPDRRRGPPGSLATGHAEELGLDAATQERIDEVIRASGERDRALREDHRAARDRMHEILGVPEPDEASVMAQAEAIEAAEAEIHKNRLRAILEIRRLLTPGQREKLLELREERERRHRGKGPRRGPPSCGRDLGEHCSSASSGKARLLCLHDHWDALSDRCRDAFEESDPKRPPRGSDAP